jgi:hypothetical protein
MGVISTSDGGLYACPAALREYFLDWTVVEAHRARFKLRYIGNLAVLLLRFEATCYALIWKPCLRSIMSQLVRIQNAVRDWLHRRKTPPRHEAALFLQASLPRDVVDMVFWALH